MSSQNTKVPFRIALISLIILIGLTQFTNCGNYADPVMNGSYSSLDFNCTNAECVMPDEAALSARVNLGGSSIYGVPQAMYGWNFAGDCNEGAFPFNTIEWQLYDPAGRLVRSSTTAGVPVQAELNRCVNGRFKIYIELRSVPGDPVNRTGLFYSGVTAAHELKVIQWGHMTPSLTGAKSAQSPYSVSLRPI